MSDLDTTIKFADGLCCNKISRPMDGAYECTACTDKSGNGLVLGTTGVAKAYQITPDASLARLHHFVKRSGTL